MSEDKCCGEAKAEPKCCGASEAQPADCAGTGKSIMFVEYDRNVHTIAHHVPLAQNIPLEGCSAFGGKGEDLNPIDLLAMGLASCLMIVMGKAAEARNLCIVGAKADVSYDLVNYKIAAINVDIKLPNKLDCADQSRLEAASKGCPVFLAISPEVAVTVNYIWPE
jgi:uncharacterized OsmC-like protein